MWRSSRTVPGVTFGPLMFATACLVAVPLATAASPEVAETTDPEFEAAEAAAVTALDFDPWVIGEQALLDARVPIDANLVTQQVGLGSAEARLELAIEALEEAVEAREVDEVELAELEELLQAFAIGTFVSSDPVYDPHPNAQVTANRRTAPLDAITEAALADVQAATEDLGLSRRAAETAESDRLHLDGEVQRRADAVARAEDLLADYDLIVSTRNEEIERRTEEALDLNDEPELGVVRGIRVNVTLVDQLEALLAAAEEDGIILSGWGHRPVVRQIELRINHCGDSGFAIFDLPAGSCSPPTARPGHSEHELGLAVDFTEDGRILNARSPGFAWLVEHAADFGLFNLPSEPWHWSTTGH